MWDRDSLFGTIQTGHFYDAEHFSNLKTENFELFHSRVEHVSMVLYGAPLLSEQKLSYRCSGIPPRMTLRGEDDRLP